MDEIEGISLDGKKWKLVFVKKKDLPKKTWGDANDSTKTLRVRTDLSGQNFLDTLIHELLHAASYQLLSEDWVEATASEIARVIVKSGRVRFDD